MKRILYIAAFCAALAGCAKENAPETDNAGEREVRISVTAATPTKSVYEDNGDAGISCRWEEGDCLFALKGVHPDLYEDEYCGVLLYDSAKDAFIGKIGGNAGDVIYLLNSTYFYPSGGELQGAAEREVLCSEALKLEEAADGSLTGHAVLHRLNAMIRFDITLPEDVERIRCVNMVTSGLEYCLLSECTIDFSGSVPALKPSGNYRTASYYVDLYSDGNNYTPGQTFHAYLPIAPADYSDKTFNIEVYTEDTYYTLSGKAGRKFEANMRYNIVLKLGIVEGSLTTCHADEIFSESVLAANNMKRWNSFGFGIKGKDIVSGRYYATTAERFSEYSNWEIKRIVQENGNEFSESRLEAINSDSGYWSGYNNLSPETTYVMYVVLTNAEGSSNLFKASYTTEAEPEYPNTGGLTTGNYSMVDGYGSTETFTVMTSEEGGYSYIIKNLALSYEASWKAVYDPDALTLICNGIEVGYESYGNQFGKPYGWFNTNNNWIYQIESYATGEDGSDPVVFAVDADTKELTSCVNDLVVAVYEYSEMDLQGYYRLYPAGTAVTRVTEETSSVSDSIEKPMLIDDAQSLRPRL